MVDLFDELRSYGRFDSTLLEQKVDDAAAKLEEDVSLAAAQKTAGLDPNYQVLNPDEFRVIDRDTVYHNFNIMNLVTIYLKFWF